jgi:hypothetical protein|tara:strand:- start:1653 stop:2003 length:351 start_codon:yes stop_codon:yes gene_type:complete
MIIPVVTRDMIYFSKLKSVIIGDYIIIQIKNEEDVDKLDLNDGVHIFIADLNDTLIKKVLDKNNKIAVIGYYPHVMKDLKDWGEELGCVKILPKGKLIKEVNKTIKTINERLRMKN